MDLIFVVDGNGKLGNYLPVNGGGIGIRPVITLKANTTISSGNGTINSPYIVK